MKVALIGLGRWGKVLLGELEKQAEVLYQADSKSDLGPVLADPEVQAVFIATPTESHFDIASYALQAGKHVFLEKPGATSSAELEKLTAMAEKSKVKFVVGYEFPNHPVAQKIKELVKMDTVKYLHMEWQKWGTFKDDAVKHLLCHEVSLLKYWGFTNLTPVNFRSTQVISDTDLTFTDFKNDQDIRITSLINRVSPIQQKTVTLITDKGGYIWSNNELFFINTETQTQDKIEVEDVTPVAAEIKNFLDSVENNTEPLSNAHFALEVYKVIEDVK